MSQKTSIPALLDSFTEQWSPRLVAAVNNHHIKVAKIDGEFIWHSHPDSDELFYVLSGTVRMDIENEDSVDMDVGDIFVVPKGVRHRPVGQDASILMIEHEGTMNTGDQTDSSRTKEVKDARS